MISIPETFECAGYTWKVRYDDKLKKREKCLGFTDWKLHEVVLWSKLQGDELYHTFLHEITHVVLNAMGQDKLNAKKYDDQVDAFAGLLYQILKTKTGRLTR